MPKPTIWEINAEKGEMEDEIKKSFVKFERGIEAGLNRRRVFFFAAALLATASLIYYSQYTPLWLNILSGAITGWLWYSTFMWWTTHAMYLKRGEGRERVR
jgi:hypothetical protein